MSIRPPFSSLVRLCLLAVVTCAPATALAQAYATRLYDDADGLPSRAVWDIAQGADGEIWVATRAGISQYDGARWRHHLASEGLPSQRHLEIDPQGRVWTLTPTLDPTPWVYEEGAWRRLDNRGPAKISSEVTSSAGRIGRDGFELVIGTVDGAVYLYRDGGWHPTAGLPPEAHAIRSLATWRDEIWAVRGDGIFVLRADSDTFARRANDLPMEPLALAVGAADALYVIGRDRIVRWDGERAETLGRDLDFELYPAREGGWEALVDPAGTIWFGTYDGLYQWDPRDGARRLGPREGIPTEGVTGLLLDRERAIWIGSPRGLLKIASPRFVSLDSRHGLPRDEVSATLQTADGAVLLGQPGALSVLDGPTFELGDPASARVLDLTESPDGGVWVAANYAGLFYLDREHRDLRAVAGPWSAVTSALETPDGLWVGTLGGLYRRQASDYRRIELAPPPAPPHVRKLDRGVGTEVLVATLGLGLHRVRDGEVEALVSRSAGAQSVFDSHVGSDGTIWVASAAGLLRVEDDSLVPVEASPSRGRRVYTIAETPDGDLWLGTDRGVIRWDGDGTRVFDRRHGLIGNETNRAASMVDELGCVWIGTDMGVSIYRPDRDWSREVGPDVELTGLEAGGIIHAPRGELELPTTANSLTFSVRAPSFVDEQRLQFRSRLAGIESDWSDWAELPTRELRFPYLPPGEYRLAVQARTIEDLEGPVVSSGAIRIAYPFWQRWWFGLLGASLLIGFGASVAFAASRGRYAARLESEVASRTARLREAERELARRRHLDGLGALAGGIAHDFNNHLAAILGNLSLIETDSDHPEIRMSTSEAIAAVGRARGLSEQLLTFSRGGDPIRQPLDLAALLEQVIEELEGDVRVECRLDEPARARPFLADPGQLRQALTELIRNACQATPAGGTAHVGVRVDEVASRLLIDIRDAGSGIPSHLHEQVFDPFFTTRETGTGLGLTIAESIARRHGGDLQIDSAADVVPG